MNHETDPIECLASALASAVRTASPLPEPRPQPHAIQHDLALLHHGHDPARPPFTSHRKHIGPAIIAIKNLARELIAQILARQARYNGANARVVSHLHQQVVELRQELDALRAQVAHLRNETQRALTPDASASGRLDEARGDFAEPRPGFGRRTPPSR